jgi:hypothetical protein
MAYTNFEDMPVWKKAMELGIEIFALTDKLPRKEDYGLVSQMLFGTFRFGKYCRGIWTKAHKGQTELLLRCSRFTR